MGRSRLAAEHIKKHEHNKADGSIPIGRFALGPAGLGPLDQPGRSPEPEGFFKQAHTTPLGTAYIIGSLPLIVKEVCYVGDSLKGVVARGFDEMKRLNSEGPQPFGGVP